MQIRNRYCEKHYRAIVILVLTIFTSFCQAQQDFRPGFIITLTGDTIKGHIDYRPPISNASVCHFRRENSNEVSKFNPEEIKAYRYNDSKFYISKELTIGGITSRHFLEYLVDGIVELYYLASKFKDAYYIEKEGIFYEVKNEDRTFRKDNKIYKSVKKEYVGTLKYLMRETPDLFDKIDKSDFNHKDFVALSQEYHESICPDYDCITYVKSSDKLHDIKWRIHPGLYLGFENSRYFMSTSTKVEMRRYITRINRDDGGRTIFHIGSRIFDEEYENSLFISNDFTPVLFLSFSNR
ncbi:MAG: hypothetical protein KDC80_18620 [Saprospiraceae bacterium]|nr:hypothetical protein [Saprospiraceae bacterium]